MKELRINCCISFENLLDSWRDGDVITISISSLYDKERKSSWISVVILKLKEPNDKGDYYFEGTTVSSNGNNTSLVYGYCYDFPRNNIIDIHNKLTVPQSSWGKLIIH